MPYRPCLICGEPGPHAYCAIHQPADRRGSATARGYDAAWTRLSRIARRMQPWCTDCGTTNDLTTDHTPAAWLRKAAGKAIRLEDVEVVCRSCNSRRGRARPDTRGDIPPRGVSRPTGKAFFGLHTPGGSR